MRAATQRTQKRVSRYFMESTTEIYYNRGGSKDPNTRYSGVLPIPLTIQLPIQSGVSAPTAAVGDGFGFLCGPLIVSTPVYNLKSESEGGITTHAYKSIPT